MVDPNLLLFHAVERGDVEAARAALASGADARYVHVVAAESKLEGDARALADAVRTPVLYLACAKKQLEMAALLLSAGADPGERWEHSWEELDVEHGLIAPFARDTCLHAAMPELALVGLLLQKGADPNGVHEENRWSHTRSVPLLEAEGQQELCALLVRFGATREVPPTEQERARMQAAASRRTRPKGEKKSLHRKKKRE